MTSNILDPAALTTQITSLLPSSNKRFTSAHDGIAVLVHTIFTVLGFRLIAVDDSSSARTFQNNVLPEDWNTRGFSDYSFRYRHEQSGLEFLVKVIRLGQRTLISAIALESDKSASLDVSTNDFTSPSFFPFDASKLNGLPLVHGFISSNRITDFVSQLKLKIIQKLVPGLRKEGYTEETEETYASATPVPQATPAPRPRPLTPPFSEDAPYHFPQNQRPYNPLEIGRRDLDPFGAFAPPSLFPPHLRGDGMYVGPDHPIFGSRGRIRRQDEPFRGPWGGDGYLPPLGAPHGARFDPVGPDPNNPLRPTFGGRPRRGGFNSGEPDNDEFMPPGVGDMFM